MSVVWLNGPIGSGKSTLAYALRALVNPVAAVALLDEDEIREAVGDSAASDADRPSPDEQMSGIARVLAQQGLVVIVAASESAAALLLWNRVNLPGYREVYLRASPETIKHRARRHRSVRGANPPAPSMPRPALVRPTTDSASKPDLTIDMDNPEPPELLAFRVAVLIPEFVVAAAGAAGVGAHQLRRGA
jgi:adenylylsulfate kinase